MRRFKLVNELGAELDLTSDPFLSEPTGLGTSFETSFARIADGFYGITSRYGAQAAVAGELVFKNNSYQKYRQFIAFCAAAKTLKLGYCPHGTWYFASCKLSKIDKSELDRVRWLRCSVELSLLGAWALENPQLVSIGADESSLTYPMTYAYTYGTEASGTCVFNVAGELGGAYSLSVGGLLEDPVITLEREEDGEWAALGEIELDGDIEAGETLQISTRPDDSYIRKTNGTTVTDLTDQISIMSNAFARPDRAGRYRLSITVSGSLPGSATVRVYDYFRGV